MAYSAEGPEATPPHNNYKQKEQAILCFGEQGEGQRQFVFPWGVAVSPLDDTICVCDSSNHRVQVFDHTGVFIKTFGCKGSGDGQFNTPTGIAVNAFGQVVVSDCFNHRVQIFDSINGNFQRAIDGSEGNRRDAAGLFERPCGVACDSNGCIYVCDSENHRVQVFDSNGDFVREFGQRGSGDGQFDHPFYVAVSPADDEKLYVSDNRNHRVQVFSLHGDFLFSFGGKGREPGQMELPQGVALDQQGFVVVGDWGNNRVQVFRADGRFYSTFGSVGKETGQFQGIEGVAIMSNGNMVVADRYNHRIQIF